MKDNTNLIEAYLNNEMLGDDLLSFENRLKIEPELAEELALHRQIRGFIKENEVANLKNEVQSWLKEEDKNTLELKPKFEQKTSLFSFSNIIKIAAAIIIVSGISWYFFSNKTSESLENQYLAELTNQAPPQLQGEDDRAIWAQAYREKKYKQVISILQNKKNTSPEEIYYLGLALSADNQLDKALIEFSKNLVTKSVYAEKAEWAKALIYLKLYKKIEAKQLLKKIGESDSQYRDLSFKIAL
jgi:hypothetical protein